MKKTIYIAVIVLVTLGTFSASARDRTYPGTNCVDDTGLMEYAYTRISNMSSSEEIFAECPIVRDGRNWDVYVDTDVWVLDVNPSRNAKCMQFCINPTSTGYEGVFSPWKYSSGSSSTPQKLDIQYIICKHDYAASLACALPRTYNGARSAVIGYHVYENVEDW